LLKPYRFLLALGTLSALAHAEDSDSDSDRLMPYRAGPAVSGTIRAWGNDEMAALMTAWEKGFQRFQPNIRFEDRLMGPASAMAGIYTGVADLSVMGHELLKEESMAFEWVFRYQALGIEVATASLDVHGNNATLVVFVHRDNPISKLTLAQLDAIYGSEHKRGPANIRNWGDLGLTGDWAKQQIHPYGYAPGSEAGSYFRQRVLQDSYKWSCELKEIENIQLPSGKVVDAGPRLLEALAKDRYGIAYAKLLYANPQVKALALATASSASVAPSKADVQRRSYPLTRSMLVYLNRDPAKPLDPKLQEFLRYVLSAEGQQEVLREGGYFPLSAKVARQQSRKLEPAQ
jgi:phosphate transport system substrate-binding protein